jgi:hypothetical protein
MVLKNWAAAGFVGVSLCLALPFASGRALAQSYSPPAPVIIAPAAGASVSSPLIVSFGPGNQANASAGSGGNPQMGGQHHHGGQAYLVVDQSALAAGDAIAADPQHIAFPPGQHQINVSLAAGPHQLQIVFANHEGEVSSHIPPSAPVTVTVN